MGFSWKATVFAYRDDLLQVLFCFLFWIFFLLYYLHEYLLCNKEFDLIWLIWFYWNLFDLIWFGFGFGFDLILFALLWFYFIWLYLIWSAVWIQRLSVTLAMQIRMHICFYLIQNWYPMSYFSLILSHSFFSLGTNNLFALLLSILFA